MPVAVTGELTFFSMVTFSATTSSKMTFLPLFLLCDTLFIINGFGTSLLRHWYTHDLQTLHAHSWTPINLTWTHSCAHIYTFKHIKHTHVHGYTHTYAHIHTLICTCIHSYTHIHTYVHGCTLLCMDTQTPMHICTLVHGCTHQY